MKYILFFMAGLLLSSYTTPKKWDCPSGLIIKTCIDPDAVAKKRRRDVWTNYMR